MDLISEIIENPNKLSNNFDTDESSSTFGSSNIVSIKCTKTLFSKEGLKNNISSYIIFIFITHFLISIILFMKCGYRLLEEKIIEIINEKEKIQRQNLMRNQIKAKHKKGKKKKGKNKFGKKINFPPKKYELNFFNNNYNLPKRKINKNSSKIDLGPSKLNSKALNLNKNSKNSKNKQTDILDLNIKNNNNFIPSKNINNKVLIKFNDFELNTLEYLNALLYDKRSCGEYYLALLKTKNAILFSFCPRNDYNSIIIRSCIFSLSFSIFYAVNFAFFNDAIMHTIYENGGKYDIVFFLPKIIISFIVSYYITTIIKIIFLSERNIIKVRQQQTLFLAYEISDKVKKNLVIKYVIFFIVGIIFLVFFWMLLSSFGAVYPNTQMFIFKNTLICFAISLVYPFFIIIFPCGCRMCSLKSDDKNKECIYKISKFLQLL